MKRLARGDLVSQLSSALKPCGTNVSSHILALYPELPMVQLLHLSPQGRLAQALHPDDSAYPAAAPAHEAPGKGRSGEPAVL